MRFFQDAAGRWIVVWGVRRDLYLIVSADRGRTWSPTRRLPAPLNSAHNEQSPLLAQDADGRYLLAFSSDRNPATGRPSTSAGAMTSPASRRQS